MGTGAGRREQGDGYRIRGSRSGVGGWEQDSGRRNWIRATGAGAGRWETELPPWPHWAISRDGQPPRGLYLPSRYAVLSPYSAGEGNPRGPAWPWGAAPLRPSTNCLGRPRRPHFSSGAAASSSPAIPRSTPSPCLAASCPKHPCTSAQPWPSCSPPAARDWWDWWDWRDHAATVGPRDVCGTRAPSVPQPPWLFAQGSRCWGGTPGQLPEGDEATPIAPWQGPG